ncbi:MAG: 50S ribosomal protein L22 [Candidatus Marinimicrobia bacterium]|jgi:large subunit ribosomal protein L22|nr:50S ribosomal protein L22 [Candidatus Neomarinimicrobiota bacterium]MBT4420120.1 50S ribosomal protein L22 [Candidatus Neomarinimicrobiota bacterium]MBT4991826.1 50S ribosomal protein L22 [Candidatus Neomarinimicrobiota bacterium]MBT5465574.1 50S ribosomal protein L22 [Candidatus Neomarinimicrobiota bacterium]MBT6759056.1 50S ribosomal protein L22 [Candidatus Neomarinimicrobiota bacterium]
MEAVAKARHIHQSARKVRQVLDEVRGKQVENAINKLHFTPKKAAKIIEKTLRSAVANAINREGSEVDADKLFVKEAFCDEGPTMRRFRPRAMGRATIIRKRTSHLTIVVAEKE